MKTKNYRELPMNAGLYVDVKDLSREEKTALINENVDYLVWVNDEAITEDDLDDFIIVQRYDGVFVLEHKKYDFRIENIIF